MQSSPKEKGWRAVIIALVGIVFVYILNAIAQGVIGHFASATLFPEIDTILTMTQWPPFLTPGLFIVALSGGCLCWWIYRTKTKELEFVKKTNTEKLELLAKTKAEELGIYDKLIRLDDLTFQWLPIMEGAQNIPKLDEVTKRAIESLLATATVMFAQNVYAGALFRLIDNRLKIWGHYRMFPEDIDGMEFDMAQTAEPIGMARASYSGKSIEIGHIERVGKQWYCTNKHYKKPDRALGPGPGESPPPHYESLICIPVMHGPNQDLLGVVAFHSVAKIAFDDPTINLLIVRIRGRIAKALELYEFLHKNSSTRPLSHDTPSE